MTDTHTAPIDDMGTPRTSEPGSEELRDLVIKSIKWSEVVYKQNKSIKKHLKWMSIMSTVRLLLVLVPIVLGIIYLPPLLSDVWDEYQSLLGIQGTVPNSEAINALFDQFGSQQ